MKENVLEPRDPLLSAGASGQIVILGPMRMMTTVVMMMVVVMVVAVSRRQADFDRPRAERQVGARVERVAAAGAQAARVQRRAGRQRPLRRQ